MSMAMAFFIFFIVRFWSKFNLQFLMQFLNIPAVPFHEQRPIHLRAASPKYRLNQEIAKKWNFFKLAQNEVFRALVTKIIV